MDRCPFCNCDPFHRADNGLGMEAVAVTCCELGDAFFRGARPAPETVTLGWDEFVEIGARLAAMRYALEPFAENAREIIDALPDDRKPGLWALPSAGQFRAALRAVSSGKQTI
jgi:hypothetical protein